MIVNKKYNIPHLYIGLVLIIVIGIFLSFVYLAQANSAARALLIGFFNATLLVLVLAGVQKFFISRLQVFSPVQQWTIRTFIYLISLSAVYITGLLFKAAILAPDLSWQSLIGERLWSGFVTFISSPLDLEFADTSTKEEFRALLIPFFAVIILIGLVSLTGSYIAMRWQQNKQHLMQERAELTALRTQIEPHFLFNSLNTIASQISTDPKKAEALILMLSDILRHIFETSSKEMIGLEEEIAFLKKYCSLMLARFDTRLQIDWQINCSDRQVKIPALLLQPLIENALRHGWKKNDETLRIKITIGNKDGFLSMTVSDNGQGIEAKRLKQLPLAGHALANINARLQLLYNKKDLIQFISDPLNGTDVTINIPVRNI
jgi:signal transduction histidine kinase